MNKEIRGERLQLMLTPEELAALDDWRFDKHMPTRAAAVRELLKRGLHAEGFEVADHRKSEEFGVVDKNTPKLTRCAVALASFGVSQVGARPTGLVQIAQNNIPRFSILAYASSP